MEHRDRVAKALPKAPHGLRCERYLGHEHDRPEAALERCSAGVQVHLGLAAARRAHQEEVLTEPFVERGHDALDGARLLGCERRRRWLSAKALPRRRRRALRAALASSRRCELERARRCGAVVVGQPQGQFDQRSGDLVEDVPDKSRRHAGRRLDPNLGHDSPRL